MRPAARRRLAAFAGVAALAAAKGVAFSLLVPPFHGPDEPYHFDYAQAVAENGALPRPSASCGPVPMFSPEVRAAVEQVVIGVAFHPDAPVPPPGALALPSWPGSRATSGCGPAAIYPPLWYATAALAYRAAGERPLLARLLAVRWSSVAWSCLSAMAALALGLLAVGPLPEAVLYALLVTLQPMAGAMESIANAEAAALACTGGALAAVAALWRGVAPRRSAAALVALLALGVLSKPSFTLALPTLAALAALALRGRVARPLLAAAALFAAPLALAGAFALSGGERSGLYHEIPSGGALAQQISRHLLAPRRLFDVWVQQYWGKLGWMDAKLARGWYVALAIAACAAIAGLLAIRRHRAREAAIAAAVGGGTLLFVAALYAIAWRRGDLVWVEGRHVLVIFPAHAYLLVRGLAALRPRLPRALDPVLVLAALVAAADLAAAFAAARRFYGPSGWSSLAAWQAAWGVPALLPAAVTAAALAALLLAWSARARRIRA